MVSTSAILIPCLIALPIIIILLAFIYLVPVLSIRRFHSINNVFTVNLCFAVICCELFWLSRYVVLKTFSYKFTELVVCLTENYFAVMCTIQVPLALIVVSVHRLCSVIYYVKPFFKTKQWATTCIVSQWTAGIVLSLPELSADNMTCQSPIWLRIYAFLIVVIIPCLICCIINTFIFKRVRSLIHRIQPPSAVASSNQRSRLRRRDLHLLQHMIVMFCIFVGGWGPIYVYTIVMTVNDRSVMFWTFIQLSNVWLLVDIVNLFFYNHQLRRYVVKKIFRCQ